MIIGNNRGAVIENIKNAAESGDFYAKVEIDDPNLTKEQSDDIVFGYARRRRTLNYKLKAFAARRSADLLTFSLNHETQVVGLENAKGIEGGAIVTSNHFSPVENTAVRRVVSLLGKRRINIVSQETNLAMRGVVGFLMNYADVIPISSNIKYTNGEFTEILEKLIKKNEYILIYPEQEMWLNYRKPRPLKRGAYYFAAKFNVPVISLFVEMRDLPEMDTPEFHKVKFIVHVLKTIYPDPALSVKENSQRMCEQDYLQKKETYERVYGKKLDYKFEKSDIAGWVGEEGE